MYPRRLIINNQSFAHVFFRCHNRNFFLKPPIVKNYLLLLLATYKRRYAIQVFDFIIMDNHAHLVVRVSSAENLGHFMRTVNSQLARFINSYFKRDSQALRERYKSPMITTSRYLQRTIQYIWLNRYKVNRRFRPENDPFCSASWRLKRKYKYVENPSNEKEKRENLLSQLLDRYEKIDLVSKNDEKSLISRWIQEAIRECDAHSQSIFENSHTIGDKYSVQFRGEFLAAFERTADPP